MYDQFSRILEVKFDKRECPLDSFHADNLHIALLSGFLGGVARRDIENGCYRLVSGRETHVFPGSDLYGKSVEWLFSAEVRETSRIFLNKGAEIKPEWIMQVAEPFCTRRWFMPTWNQERGFVEAVEEVSFRGLVISRGHRVDYARVNPDECAEIFWREAVVLGQMARPFAFMTHNERVVEDLHGLEARKRQFGLAPSEDALVDYYVRIAPRVNSIKTLKDYICEHTDQFLKFDAKFWLDQLDERTGAALQTKGERGFNKILLPEGSKARSADLKAQTPSLGGSLEQFRIECLDGSSRMVVGEMVFDATKEYDGITLDLPYDLIPQLTPAKLALSIHQWREWMIESIVREMPKAAKKQLENRRTFIDDAFCDRLKAAPHKSPMVSLYEVFAGIKQLDCDIPTVTPEKENHLRLHAKIFKTGFPEKFACEINPEWGSFNLFAAVRPIVVTFGIDFALGEMRFGWRLGESALMTSAESAFWQAFRKRVEGCAKSAPEADAPKKDAHFALIADRLNLLETGGLYSDGFKTALKAWVLKSLAADNLDANRCVRFNGLEFSRGKKINDFKNLAATSRSEDDEVRLALVRATYESALLGAESFVAYWDILREFSVAMRQGGDHARDAIAALTAGHKFIAKIIALYSPDGPENTLFERLCILGETLPGAPNLSRDKAPARPELSVRTLREKFRPFLKARFMKDHELKKARDILSEMERLSQDDAEYPELYLQACAMLEDFEVLKFKRKGDDSEEVIEENALAKLKGRFGRL